jgi:hypothetical protein
LLEINLENYLEAAQARAEEVGTLDRSMRGLQANQVGALGELIGLDYLRGLGFEVEEIFSTKFDVRVKVEGEWKTLEFKTKERTVIPQPSYDCTVPAYNHSFQRPDYFLFISLLSSGKSEKITRFSKGFILGSISLERFEEIATAWDPSKTDTSNGWTPTINCYNVRIGELDPPKERKLNAAY